MSDNIPAWRAAWRLDDPEWVKNRQKEWKKIKSSVYCEWFGGFDKEDWAEIKNLFMTGCAFDPELPEEKWRLCNYHPDTNPLPLPYAMLLELWLTAADSDENFQRIYKKYSDDAKHSARDRFREALLRLYAEHGSLFSRREARIYRLLGPTRCRREDFPDEDEEAYISRARYTNSALGVVIDAHLSAEEADPENVAPELVREWADTVPAAYRRARRETEETGKRFLQTHETWQEKIVSRSREIVNSPDDFDPSQVRCATDVIAYLSEMELPEELDNKLAPFFDKK